MRVLITGADGQLGQELVRALPDDDLLGLGHSALDVTNEPAVWAAVRESQPEVVINSAALTSLEACESDPHAAWAVNTGGAANLARACAAAGAWLVQISSVDVFDGTLDRPYTEFDRPNPLTVLGRTKEAGEQLVRQLCPSHQIVRTGWLQGQRHDSFIRSMLRLARERQDMKAPADQVGNPTFTADLAPALRQLAATRRTGTYHVTNIGTCTWHELASEALRLAGIGVAAKEVKSGPWSPGKPRKTNSSLEGRNTQLAGLAPLPHWRDGLCRFLAELSV